MTDKQVAPDVTFNGVWYSVNTPSGETWTFEDGDKDIEYIENALFAWSRWLDFVKGEQGE